MSYRSCVVRVAVSLALGLAPIAHAGDVTAVLKGTSLKVTGVDDLGVEPLLLTGLPEGATDPTPAFVRVVVTAGLVNGVAGPAVFNGVTRVTVSLGDGSNRVNFQSLVLEDGISAKGGSGTDIFVFSQNHLGGNASLNGGKGSLSFSCSGGETAGKLDVKSSSADDGVSIACRVSGDARLALGDGANEISFGETTVKSLSIKTGSGGDLVDLAGIVDETLSLQLGDGDNSVSVVGLTVGKNLNYKSGKGSDTVTASAIYVGEKASLNLGNGPDTLVIGSDPSLIVKSLSVSSGGDPDTIVTNSLQIGEDAAFNLGNGGNTLVLEDTPIGDDLSVTAGAGDDTVVFLGTTSVGDKTKLSLGGGTNTP